MLVNAKAKFIKLTPNKVRQVLGLIRGKDVVEALTILSFVDKRPKTQITKVVNSAVASAKAKGIEPRQLYVSKAVCENGPMWKRFRAAAFGRATRIRKRTSHITIELDLKT